MDVTPLIKQGTNIIQAYAGGQFKVSGQTFDTSIFLGAGELIPWSVSDMSDLCIGDFEPLFSHAQNIDVLLIGTGKTIAFIPQKLKQELKDKGLSCDCMDTGAACRTYNVLVAEGRRVFAALCKT